MRHYVTYVNSLLRLEQKFQTYKLVHSYCEKVEKKKLMIS